VSNTMRWLDARAKFYESLGAFEKTKFLYELCVELCALVGGKRHRDLIAPLQELASFEIDQGYFVEARTHIDAAIEIAELAVMPGFVPGIHVAQPMPSP
jgi:hypothetical protein